MKISKSRFFKILSFTSLLMCLIILISLCTTYFNSFTINFFKQSSSVFISVLLSLIFFVLHIRAELLDGNESVLSNSSKRIYSLILFIIALMLFTAFYFILRSNGFMKGDVLYKQVVSLSFGVLAILLTCYVYIQLKNKKPPKMLIGI